MQPKASDPQLMAYKALTLAPDLSGSARQVAGALLDHFNRKTMQCDPTIETLSDLTGLHLATVKRALAEVCDSKDGTDTAKYFERWPHEGKSRRTFYLPRWARFEAVLTAWGEARKRRNRGWRGGGGMGAEMRPSDDGGIGAEVRPSDGAGIGAEVRPSDGAGIGAEVRLSDGGGMGAEMRPSQAQNCAPDRRKTAPQTLYRNPFKEPIDRSQLVAPGHGGTNGSIVRGLGKGRGDAAVQAAERRLQHAVGTTGNKALTEALFLVGEAAWDDAREAELQRRGTGFAILLEQVDPQLRRYHG